MILLKVDATSRVPIYQQIREQIVTMVDGGMLLPGDRLPPTRVLARALGVHRSTVLRAYGELWALGYLESRPGSYSTVRRRARPIAAGGTARDGARSAVIRWERAATAASRRAHRDAGRLAVERGAPGGAIDFARLAIDPLLLPQDDVRYCLRTALLRHGRDLLDYGDARGYLPLRETIARRMRSHGVAVAVEEVLITNGAQQGLDLTLRLLARPGDAVAIESPTYAMALALMRLHEVRLQAVPMRSDGVDLDALATTLARRRVVFFYTMPNFHNPTGITTDQSHRERLLALCEARRVPIIEDGFEEEMKYFGEAVLPIKSMDTRGVVIYLGTFSKVVFPGLRVGWIAAPSGAIESLSAVQRITNLAGNSVVQAAVARFCSSGRYEAHLRRVHKVYRRRMQAMLAGLRENMPPGVEWTEPVGGYTLWLRVRNSAVDERTLTARIAQAGVSVTPGSLSFANPPREPHFRLSISCAGEQEIAEGCRRLGRALAAALPARLMR